MQSCHGCLYTTSILRGIFARFNNKLHSVSIHSMKYLLKYCPIVLLCLGLTQGPLSCARITVKREHVPTIEREPDYVQRKSYYLFGIIGQRHVNTRIACKGRNIEQVRAEHTPGDVMMTMITLGLYVPKTAKVWCEEQ